MLSAHTKFMRELGRGFATSDADPGAFFARWVDYESWPAWSPDTEWVTVAGPVVVGARGVLKPRGAPKANFVVSVCSPGCEYTDTTLLPGARMVFQHTVAPHGAGSELHVEVTMSGPLSFVWAILMGGKFRKSAQADLDRLVALVEAP